MESNNNNGTRTMLYDKNEKKYYLVLKLPKEKQEKLDKNQNLNVSQRSRKFYLALKKREQEIKAMNEINVENTVNETKSKKKWKTHCIDLGKLKQQDISEIDKNSTQNSGTNNIEIKTDVDIDSVDVDKMYTKLGEDSDLRGKIVEYLNKSNENTENSCDYDHKIYEIDKKWFDKDLFDENIKKEITGEIDRPISTKKSSFRVGYELFFSRIWLGLITPCIVTTWFAPSAFKFLENVFENPLNVFTVWDGFNNPLYNFANAIFCCLGVLGIGLSLMAIVRLFSSQENKKKRREDRKNISEFKFFSTESALSIFALVMTGCYATQTVINMTAQGILPIVTNLLTCVPDVFAILGFAFSMLNLALRIKDKVELNGFNKTSELNKSNKNNVGERFVDLTRDNNSVIV